MLINNVKYSCETCIKGHRSSSCKHSDRPLFEIKKKGRPITQCEKCRSARQTRKLHTKCLCSTDPNDIIPPASEPRLPAVLVVPDHPVFPNGLPQELLPAVSSDDGSGEGLADFVNGVGIMCLCKPGDVCTHRAPKKRRVRKKQTTLTPENHLQPESQRDSSVPESAYILARIAELRPVLPREGRVHHPSSGTINDTHHHSQNYFSPYGRAYEYIPSHMDHDRNADPQRQLPLGSGSWYPAPPSSASSQSMPFPAPCNCGSACACPGCLEHNPGTIIESAHAYSTCVRPEMCASCLDCTVMSMPASAFTAEPGAADATQSIDDWLRQISLPPTGQQLPSSSSTWLSMPTVPSNSMLNQAQLAPASWDNESLQLPPIISSQRPETPPPSPVHRARSTKRACVCRPACVCGASDCEDSSSDHGHDGTSQLRRSVSDGGVSNACRGSPDFMHRGEGTSFSSMLDNLPPLSASSSSESGMSRSSPQYSTGGPAGRYPIASSPMDYPYPDHTSYRQTASEGYDSGDYRLYQGGSGFSSREGWPPPVPPAQAASSRDGYTSDYANPHYSDS